MPLRSAKVVESAASAGGLWFHPGRKMVSSVREGQFMMRIVPEILNGERQNEKLARDEVIKLTAPGKRDDARRKKPTV
jgi:hypothetical protein